VICGKPPSIDNADRAGDSSVVAFPDTINYRCLDGYMIQGKSKLKGKTSFEVKCEADGSFSGIEACPPVPCPEVDPKEHPFALCWNDHC
jgi:hypothetical protein